MLKVRIKRIRQALQLFNGNHDRILKTLNSLDGWRANGLIKSSRDYTTRRRELERELKLVKAGIEHLESELRMCEGLM